MTTTTRAASRAAAQARQEAARREAARRRTVRRVGAAVVAALLLAIAAAVATSAGGEDVVEAPRDVVVPAHATADGSIPVGSDGAPVTVSVYFDYMCPFCGRFEAAQSADLDRLVRAGQARVELRPLAFLDAQSQGSRFSTRAANAVATVADGAPEQVWAFHRALFDSQPAEGTEGLSDDRLADLARRAGVPAPVVERFTDRVFQGWVGQVTQRAFDDGLKGTPTVLVDGQLLQGDLYTPGVLARAVAAAAEAP